MELSGRVVDEKKRSERKRSKNILLTLVIINVVVTVHLQWNGAV